MYTKKVEIAAVKTEYSLDSTIEEYEGYVREIVLWKSEGAIFDEFVNKKAKILDLGCGAGRTTIAFVENGWHNIIGVDLSERMIKSANKISEERSLKIAFEAGDATNLGFAENEFDTVLFSFNGLMTIPDRKNRVKAMAEIHRVLQTDGIFIFTTHDRTLTPEEFKQFWIDEAEKWKNGKQGKCLIDFGDVISEKNSRSIFIHIAVPDDVRKMLEETGFKLVETKMRSEIADETVAIKEYSMDCRFWVVRKK